MVLALKCKQSLELGVVISALRRQRERQPGLQRTPESRTQNKQRKRQAQEGKGESEHHQYALVAEKEPTLLIWPDSMQDHTWF